MGASRTLLLPARRTAFADVAEGGFSVLQPTRVGVPAVASAEGLAAAIGVLGGACVLGLEVDGG